MPARQKPTFGQGQVAAKVLRRVIAAAAAVGGRLPADTSVTLARPMPWRNGASP
jgi:hypothetical protein